MKYWKKCWKKKPDLPVIMLTGHGDRDSAEQALVLGAFDYLSKPCDIDLLSDKIREACQSKTQSGKAEEDLVGAVMIPLSAYTTIDEGATIAEAVHELKTSFVTFDGYGPDYGNRSQIRPGHGPKNADQRNSYHPGPSRTDPARVFDITKTGHGRQHPVLTHVLEKHVYHGGEAGPHRDHCGCHVTCSGLH